LALYLHPGRGGHLYEFDLREVNFNVADTFSRRYEAYHEKVPQATVTDPDAVTTIHGLVRAKEEGLDKLLRYDAYLRESLVDHLGAAALTPADFLSGDPPSDPGFRQGRYQASWAEARPPAGTAPGGTVVLTRAGRWAGGRLELRKTVKLTDGSDFEVEYELRPEGTAAQQGFLAVEMNYNLLAGNAEDRYYCHEGAERAGPLNLTADFGLRSWIGLMDRWLGIRLRLRPSVKAQVLVSPVRTVSNSEGGFESVYQSSSVVLQWPVRLRAGQPFRVRLVQEVGRVRA
jgi:alpha-amylase